MEVLSRSEIFEKSKCGKEVKCRVCNCWLHSFSDKVVDSHINGKKHKLHLERLAQKEHKLKHGLYVKGFDPLLENLEENLRLFLQDVGGPIKDIYVDKNAGNYCIVEFVELESVARALSSDQKKFHGKKLVVRERDCSKSLLTTDVETKANEDKTTSLNKELEVLISKQSDIDAQMKSMHDYLKLTEEEIEMRKLVCDLLQSVLEEAYPGCDVKMFGSTVNGLGARGCDLDVTLLTPESAEGERDSNGVMKEVREIIERYAPGFKNVMLVESVKNCSIVKMCHTQSELNVDLSLNNRLAIENTSLLKQYVNSDEKLVPLFFAIRYWAKMNNMTGRSGLQISNYALMLMIIRYLQQLDPPYLNCLQTCHEISRVDINQWNCAFCQNHSPINFDGFKTGQLLSGFFQFYGSYSFSENVIAIHSNVVMKLSECIDELNSSTALVVQDPFKLSHNVAQNMSQNGLVSFQSNCKETYERLKQAENINLLALFQPPPIRKQSGKVAKRKHNNKGNEYLISLPNCKHQRTSDKESNRDYCCYDVTRDILSGKLKMQIRSELCNLIDLLKEKETFNQNIEIPKATEDLTVEVDKFANKIACSSQRISESIITDNNVKSCRKRRHGETADTYDCVEVKKQKIDHAESMEFFAYAFSQTWINRRKERRERQRNQSNTVILPEEQEASSTTSSGTASSEYRKSTTNEERLPILCVKMILSKATIETDVCKIKFEPVTDETVKTKLEDFQIFFAYLKKELVTIFK